MLTRHIILIIIVLGFLSPGAFAEATENQLTLKLDIPEDLEVFYWKDFDFEDSFPQARLFSLEVSCDRPVRGYFELALSNSDGELLKGVTDIVELPKGIHLFDNRSFFSAFDAMRLMSITGNAAANLLYQKSVAAGYIPADRYRLRISLCDPNPHVATIARDEKQIELTNPLKTRLISPLNSEESAVSDGSLLPVFTWSSQGKQFLLKIWQSGGEETVDSLVYQTDPHYPLDSQSYLFPAMRRPLLKAGQAYSWQVTTLVKTSSGIRAIHSPVGSFILGATTEQRILAALKQILGQQYQSVVEKQLVGYHPTGTILLRGDTITIEELEAMAREFADDRIQTVAVGTE